MNRGKLAVTGWLTASLLLMLGALLVLWGTEYKLSLYKAESTMQVPAKLCTRSSEAAQSELHLAIQPVEADAPFLYAIAIGSDQAANGTPLAPALNLPDAPLPSSPRDLPQEAFRPPPAPARVTV